MISIDTLCIMLYRDGNQDFAALPFAPQVIASINQAVSVRNAGFAVLPLDMFVYRPAFFILQLAMMFIQQYPVIVIMRNTNLYLERSVGISKEDITYTDLMMRKDAHPSVTRRLARRLGREEGYVFLREQLRHSVTHDIWLLFCATLLPCILETYLRKDELRPVAMIECLKIATEVISGYGNVGLSWGLVGTAASLCCGWYPLSKVILCCVMIKGKQRGLPVALDHAQPSAVGDAISSAEGRLEEAEAVERERRQSHADAINAEAEGENA